MKKLTIFILIFLFSKKKVTSQTLDTLNFLDDFGKYVEFLDTVKTSKVCSSFKNSKYYVKLANRKPYPEYILNNDYYEKYKINEVDFVTFGAIYPEKDYLLMFAFYSPSSDSSYISKKLTNNGWIKEKSNNDLNAIFSKTINENNYFIDCQKFPDDRTFRYFITIRQGE